MELKVKEREFIGILSPAMIQTENKNTITPEIEEVLNQVYPGVWVLGTPGKAKNAAPIRTELKVEASPVLISEGIL